MNKPKMILFDYGQTLGFETRDDWTMGLSAVLDLSLTNPYNATPEELSAFAWELAKESHRYDDLSVERNRTELPEAGFLRYMSDWFGLTFEMDYSDLELVLWDACAPAVSTPHIVELMDFLDAQGIRTAVISNLSYGGTALNDRVRHCVPNHRFEFMLSTCDYVFKKPSPRIYGLALRKAGLNPEDVWFCGDNCLCDVDGPAALGMTAVWYAAKPHVKEVSPQQKHIKIQDWNELVALLKSCT